MMPISQSDQRIGKGGAGVAPTCGAASPGAGLALSARAYPPLLRGGVPPGSGAAHSCLLPCCDFPAKLVKAKARETKSGAAGRAGGAWLAGRGIIRRWLRAAGTGLLLVVAGQALAHSWYPFECCSERDCYAVPASRVQVVPGGWIIDGFPVRHGEARPSPDGRFHICRREDGKGDLIRKENGPACAWAPVEGS